MHMYMYKHLIYKDMHFPGLRTALIVAEHKDLKYTLQQVITTQIKQWRQNLLESKACF